jgi:hypothetical protein
VTAKALVTAESQAVRTMAGALPKKLAGKPKHAISANKK